MSNIPAAYRLLTRLAAVLAFACSVNQSIIPEAHCSIPVAHPEVSPNFSLPDLSGKQHSLRSYSGRSAILFFFCGCDRCHAAARAWAQIERAARAGSMEYVSDSSTIVVFSGNEAAARQFEKETMLDPGRTVLLLDPEDNASEGLYHADECPRVFVLNSSQVTLYTNTREDDSPLDTDPSIMIARATSALAANSAKADGKN